MHPCPSSMPKWTVHVSRKNSKKNSEYCIVKAYKTKININEYNLRIAKQ